MAEAAAGTAAVTLLVLLLALLVQEPMGLLVRLRVSVLLLLVGLLLLLLQVLLLQKSLSGQIWHTAIGQMLGCEVATTGCPS